jgi:hypothetical protein
MAQQTKSTHQAHCQVCGRLQAVMAHTGRIAKPWNCGLAHTIGVAGASDFAHSTTHEHEAQQPDESGTRQERQVRAPGWCGVH